MKNILFLILLIPFTLFGSTNQDSINNVLQKQISILGQRMEVVDSLKHEFNTLNSQHEYQLKINEQTLNSISNQIGATSFNLTVFGILFTIAALGLGIYVTYIERKTVAIREDTRDLLKQTIRTKDEVESINKLIQKDIYGLFLKIKREETVHILNRLLKVPEDISNLSNELLSRELEQEDFSILKEAYLKLKPEKELEPGHIRLRMEYKDSYHLLFFQHFLDLAIADETIGPELINFYPEAINCAFKNDITKSTEDFIKAIVDKGFQHCEKEINSYIKGLSQSDFKDFDKVYEILFNGLKNREDRFKFFDLIDNNKDSRIGKSRFGQFLKTNYLNQNPTNSEKGSFDQLLTINKELEEEEQKRKKAREKK